MVREQNAQWPRKSRRGRERDSARRAAALRAAELLLASLAFPTIGRRNSLEVVRRLVASLSPYVTFRSFTFLDAAADDDDDAAAKQKPSVYIGERRERRHRATNLACTVKTFSGQFKFSVHLPRLASPSLPLPLSRTLHIPRYSAESR